VGQFSVGLNTMVTHSYITHNPSVERDCAKARSPSLLRWASKEIMKTRYFPRWTSPVLLAVSILLTNPAFAAFIISSESNCYGNDAYSYYFSETAFSPDYTVKVSETAFSPDITLKIVSDPRQADLILVDGFTKGNMKVCKKSNSIGVKTIKVSNTAFSPDITVKLSETSFSPDYKIFILSETFTKEEAAALFAVILKESRKK